VKPRVFMAVRESSGESRIEPLSTIKGGKHDIHYP
jgi:hypothetical protein